MIDNGFRVIKLGGSLLDLHALVPQFRRWLGAQATKTSVTVVGGGDVADAIRDAFARQPLDESDAHWLCIRALGVTADLMACLMPEGRLVRRFEQIRLPEHQRHLIFFECEQFLREVDAVRSPSPLPHSWSVTSDSIAARLAEHLGASELVLLKSSLPETGSVAKAAESGYVDHHFPEAVAGIPLIRCVNLRDEDLPEMVLEP